MLRHLPLCAVILILACPPSAVAESPAEPQSSPRFAEPAKPKPSFTERFKSLFSRKEKPAPRPPVPHPKPAEKMTSQKPPTPPVQVTTRSGSLRQPGPETHRPLKSPATPTFAPKEIPLAGQSPRMLNPLPSDARRLPGAASPAPKKPIRDPGVRAAAFETEQKPEKKSMMNWFRGLWPRKDKAEEQIPAVGHRRVPRTAMPGEATSIDPRKVYRTPQPEPEKDPRVLERSFSETGIPGGSQATFRRRAGSY